MGGLQWAKGSRTGHDDALIGYCVCTALAGACGTGTGALGAGAPPVQECICALLVRIGSRSASGCSQHCAGKQCSLESPVVWDSLIHRSLWRARAQSWAHECFYSVSVPAAKGPVMWFLFSEGRVGWCFFFSFFCLGDVLL